MSLCGTGNGLNNNEQRKKTKLTIRQELSSFSSSVLKFKKFEDYWLEYGSKHPILSKLVNYFNSISATSVPSESSFSFANYISRKERASLSPEALRYSMVLKNFIVDSIQ